MKMQQYVTFAEKHSQSSLLKIKIIEKLGTIAILQVNTEVQLIVYVTYKIILIIKETNSEPSEISETKISTKIVNGWKPLAIFAKSSISEVYQISRCTPELSKTEFWFLQFQRNRLLLNV